VPFYKDLTDLRIGTTQPEHPLLLEKIKELSVKNQSYFILYFQSKPFADA